MRTVLFLAVLIASTVGYGAETAPEGKRVLLAILARNKEHVLPRFLDAIEKLDYDKKLITVYINTNNNIDKTVEILSDWKEKNQQHYANIILEKQDIKQLATASTGPHDWRPLRVRALAHIRNKSLKQTKKHGCDYYFVVDCDNFIEPSTLKVLVSKDKPIIAPLLYSIPEPKDEYCNFFYAVNEKGFYEEVPEYFKVLRREMIGTFKVAVVHCTYLIKADYIDKLNYLDDSNDYEFIIFSRNARNNGVDQYICNEEQFGTQLHYNTNLTLQQEQRAVNLLFHNRTE